MNRGSPRQVLECASLLVFWRFGDGGETTKSARGLAQSKTLPRNPQVHGPHARHQSREGFPGTAFNTSTYKTLERRRALLSYIRP